METGEFEIFCLRTYNDLFKRARTKSPEAFLTSLLTLEEDSCTTSISCTQEAELFELSTLINDVIRIISSPKVSKTIKARMRLFAYSHIIQVDAIYQILSNLANIILNLEYDPRVYYIDSDGKKRICRSVDKKIEAISKKVASLDIPVDTIFEYVYYPKIHDSFTHSQYMLSEGANLVLTKKILASTSSTVKRYFRYSELQSIFDKCLVFLQTFLEIYGSTINSFRDGKPHKTLYGEVHFSRTRGWTLMGC